MWLSPSGETPALWLRWVAIYAAMGLAVLLMALLSGPPVFSALQWPLLVFVATLAALALVYIALHVLARLAGWQYVQAKAYRVAAAREMARRGRINTVVWDGIVGWGWPVGAFALAVQQLYGGQGLGDVTLLQAALQLLIWSVAGGVFGWLLWDMSKTRPSGGRRAAKQV